jgi:hypothetical protein
MAKAKKARKPGGRPAPKAEPTTHQLRQQFYARRAEQQALEDLGIDLGDRQPPKGEATWWADTRDALDRLEIVHAVWRYAGLTGRVPEPEDWDPKEGWPSDKEVEQVFKDWDDMLDASGIDDAVFGELLRKVADAHGELGRRREALEAAERRLEAEGRKIPELKRQVETARAKREEADARVREAEGARLAAERERDRLTAQLDAQHAELVALREPAAASAADATAAAEAERLRVELAQATARAEGALAELDRLSAAAEDDARTISELTRTLATLEVADEAAGDGVLPAVEEEPPGTVLEAVQRAAAEARALRFAPKAFETAGESPFRRPGLVLKTLRALDEIAVRFAEGEMGRSIGQAAAEVGITQWRPDVSETTRKRYEDDYSFTWEGRKLWVGPHVGLGSGSGAGFVARIYLHVADGAEGGVDRGIYVGVVGRHLPDTTTG